MFILYSAWPILGQWILPVLTKVEKSKNDTLLYPRVKIKQSQNSSTKAKSRYSGITRAGVDLTVL
jgi:hypothetical protein